MKKWILCKLQMNCAFEDKKSSQGRQKEEGKDAQWYRATFTCMEIFKDSTQSQVFGYLVHHCLRWLHSQGPWFIILIVTRHDQTFWSNVYLFLLLPPKRQRSSINSHLAESTSVKAISSKPPLVSLPYGEATKCTWEEVRVTSWWSFVFFGNAPSTCDI